MILALLLIPTLAGLAAFFVRANRPRRALLVAAALAHNVLTVLCWIKTPKSLLHGWLALDPTGLLFLTIASLLFIASAIYGIGYLREHASPKEASFTGCLLLFLASMTLATVAERIGLIWIAVEGTTLASAPLIYFRQSARSLEATWKYLLICSVGIALALLGNFFLAVSATNPHGPSIPLVLGDLVRDAEFLNAPWLKMAFVFMLVGYGTKMGLAPMHTWLPDAHSESPSLVSALLSGALLNCAFLAIVRIYSVCAAAGLALFARDFLIAFGLLSMAISAIFLLGQRDYKRLLAYSSVEHMGILAVGLGIGGSALMGAMFHAVNHSATKAALFLLSGNLLARYKSKAVDDVTGAARVLPVTGFLWLAGFFAITGMPPFGIFLSKFMIVKAALDQDLVAIAVAFLAMLALIFIGMGSAMLRMAQGPAPAGISMEKERLGSILPPLALLALVLALGFYLPAPLRDVLVQISKSLGTP
jgi:hydrogenase-4 component F